MIKALLSAPLALSLFLSPIPAQAAPPSKAEQTMIATVDAEQARHLALLEKLVNQTSGTRNLKGVRAVQDMLVPEFAALGFTVRWVDQSAVGRAGHFIAEQKGKKGTKGFGYRPKGGARTYGVWAADTGVEDYDNDYEYDYSDGYDDT